MFKLMKEKPAQKLWLYKNPEALKQVQEGLKQSKKGKVRKRGSFARYVKQVKSPF